MPVGNIGVTKLFYYVMVGTAAVYSHPAMMDSSSPVPWYGSSMTKSRVTVPEAVQHLMAMAVPQREEMAVLCSIPDTAPYWVSPEDVNECNLVQLNNNIGTWATYLSRVCCYRCITFHLQSTMRSFIALSRGVCGRQDIKARHRCFLLH